MKVLDLGSGYNPYSKADVLVDRYLEGNDTSRYTGDLKTKGKPLVCANMEHLPFADKSFDIIICQQTIEHVKNPGLACAEMVRVGKCGFLTAPRESAMREDCRNDRRPYHLWLVKQRPMPVRGMHLDFYPTKTLLNRDPMEQPDRGTVLFWIDSFTWTIHDE